jgi:2'-5' RNA ligase
MVRVGDLIIVHMLQPQAVGSYFDRQRWPLHITLLQWFGATQSQHEPLERSLRLLAQAAPSVSVTVGEEAAFGPNREVPVHVITQSQPLMTLHQDLLSLINLLQLPLRSPQYTGEHFTPHVTQHEDRHARIGDTITVSDFYLVQLFEESTCQIIDRFD